MLELFASEYRPLVQDALAYSICLAAFVWGAGPERAIAAVWFVFFEVTGLLYDGLVEPAYQLETIDLFLATTDVCVGVLWIVIAVHANRNYPLFMAALQLLVVSAHVARGLIEAIAPIAYAVMVIAPGWLQLLLLATGLVRHLRRKRRYGNYRDWRTQAPWMVLAQTRKKWSQ